MVCTHTVVVITSVPTYKPLHAKNYFYLIISTFRRRSSNMFSSNFAKPIWLKSQKLARVLQSKNLWKINVCDKNQSVSLECKLSGETLKFSSVWLRDNCQCSACFDKTLHSRIIPLKQFKSRILPETIKYEKNESGEIAFNVEWPDKHRSVYTLAWLKQHNFDEESQNRWLENHYRFRKTTWNSSNFANMINYFAFEKILYSDLELLKWLITLNEKGIAIVKGVGSDENSIERLADRVGFIKKTTYGKLFRVEANQNATNAAYRSTPLELHIDLPYYEYCPSFTILHYVKQSKLENEGVNYLVDGFELSRQMKNYDSDMYAILTSTLIEWTDIAKNNDYQMHHIYRAPVICQDSEGNVIRVNFSQHQRDAHFNVSIERVNKWYEAMNWFIHLAFHPKNLIALKMQQGDMLTFDNLRILHGRGAFTTSRCLIGAYLDADIVNSRIRVLLSEMKTQLSSVKK